MKHILICLVCSVLLFSYIGRQTVIQDINSTALGANIAQVAAAATTPVKKGRSATPVATQLQVGILLGHADDLGTARFKNSFEKGLPTEVKVNTVDTAGSLETQKTMFGKMLESGYNLIVLELTPTCPAEYFIDEAGQAGVPMIIIGQEPSPTLLQKYPGIYYLGFSNDDLMALMAQETATFWQNNPKMMDFEDDTWDMTYSAITSTGFAEPGKSAAFEGAMAKLGISTSMAVDSVVRHYEYDLHKEIDQTIIKDSELVIYDSSVEAQKAINYYYDPTEFTKRPKQQLALSVIDDGATKLVADGEVLFACGTDTKALGDVAARIGQLLLAGQVPTFQTLEIEPVADRSFYLPGTVLRAPIVPESIEEPADS